jgi:hypothetical protein
MIDIILSHWAMYLLLAWLVVLGVIGLVNLWPKKKSARRPEAPRFAMRNGQREPAPAPFTDEFKLARHDR